MNSTFIDGKRYIKIKNKGGLCLAEDDTRCVGMESTHLCDELFLDCAGSIWTQVDWNHQEELEE